MKKSINDSHIRLPAEWEKQDAVQMTWFHAATDWAPYINEVRDCFVNIFKEIIKREQIIIICDDATSFSRDIPININSNSIIVREIKSNDTWARDHAGITVLIDGKPIVYDFSFNGWGGKYPAEYDNLITSHMAASGIFCVPVISKQPFVLEGGSIESDGCNTILTTSRCQLARNRNLIKLSFYDNCELSEGDSRFGNHNYISSKDDLSFITDKLKSFFGASRILWLHHGYLTGDDTDGHIDTLARFCDPETIAYVQCNDPTDEHFIELQAMEEELCSFRTLSNTSYRLLPLPMADPIYYDDKRLPATYANFLIIHGAVLVPYYNTSKDAIAAEVLQQAFPAHQIVGIDCRVLLRQHGSLHCLTMQYPEGVINPNLQAN